MTDQRGDEPGPDDDTNVEPDHDHPPGHHEGERPPPPDDLQIAEMSPPPPPASADEPTAVGGPIGSPPDDPADTEMGAASSAPPPVVPVGPGPVPSMSDPAASELVGPAPAERPWPTSAKVAVALLVVLALLGVAGTIFGLARASSAEDDVDALEAELAIAEDRVVALEDQLGSLGDETGTMSDRLDQLTSERDQAVAERDAAIAERDEQLAIAEAEQALLETRIEELEGQVEELEGQVATLEEALGEVDGQFPLSFDTDLGQVDLDGTYSISFTEIFCMDLADCGSPPPDDTALISSSGQSFEIPGYLVTSLQLVDGTPAAVSNNDGVLEPCGDVERPVWMTVALFADQGEVDASGGLGIDSLGASIVIEAPAVAECEQGRVWYRAELTRQG
jgi:hypothetical protein